MEVFLFNVVSCVLAAVVFSLLAVKYEWREKIWRSKLNEGWSVFVWLIGFVIGIVCITVVAKVSGVNAMGIEVSKGIGMGLGLSLMPNLKKRVMDEQENEDR